MTRSFSSRSSDAASTSSTALGRDHRDAVGVEHDGVAGADRRAADLTGSSSAPGSALPAPRTRIQRAHIGTPSSRELLDVAHGGVDEQRGRAARPRLRREQVAEAARPARARAS